VFAVCGFVAMGKRTRQVLWMGGIRMNKIEIKMYEAIDNKQDMEEGNTVVFYSHEHRASGVFLHDHNLGNFMHDTRKFVTNIDTLREYPTKTTLSRLRALGVEVERYNNSLWLDGECICNLL
jgi:hypothetical protein